MTRSGVAVLFFTLVLLDITCLCARSIDYIAPLNPCRHEDRLCSVKCTVMRLKGEFNCGFCVCANKEDYVKWDTAPTGSTLLPQSTTSLPPDVIVVNNIKYHRVGDPCKLSHDGMCPSKCTETQSTKLDGSTCTLCDCKGAAVLIG